ncbi:AAA family ATPase [Fusobacterium polymorphum]|uniref:AAA family ATPase n=1 Tax=Fusobacterium nucleatum subsp. polymorphum TaxID=76857 RepID=UPI003009D110
MIKAIEINNFGSFKDFNWKKDVGNYTTDITAKFSEINIIYGRNYSGKTTLSRIINCLDKKVVHPDYINSNFEIILEDSTIIKSDNLYNTLNVKVYNSDFMKEKLKWFYDKNYGIEPFTILGEKNIDVQNKIENVGKNIEEIDKKIIEKNSEFTSSEKNFKEIKEKLETKLTEEARKIKENTNYFNVVTYTRKTLTDSFSKIKKNNVEILTDEEKIELKKQIDEGEKNQISLLDKLENLDENQINEINQLLKTQIKITEPIQELLNNSLLEKWVRQGKELQKNRETCAFCGSILTDEIWEKINKHFNNESEIFIKKLDETLEQIKILEKRLENYKMLNSENIISTLSEKLKSELFFFNTDREKLRKYYIDIKEKIEKKRDQISSYNEIPFFISKINEIIDRINFIINEHNEYCKSIEERKKDARNKLLLNKEKELFLRLDYTEKSKAQELAEKEKNNKEKELNSLNIQKTELKNQKLDLERSLKDETKAAELINKYLKDYFGRNDLELKIDKDKKIKFSIYRGAELALNLSEGECSLIAFSYFLATIKDYEKTDNLILWIDDPISSLDNNQIFFTFGAIDKIIIEHKYNQIFISTHNLDFLKYLKRLKNEKAKVEYFLVEREIKQDSITSKIRKMPSYLKEYVTEFHYLFNEIYKVANSQECCLLNTYNQLYNIPNNMRKFLEYYLFYRYPDNKEPLKNLEKIFDTIESRSINRIINENSHLTFIDRGWKPFEIPEIQSVAKIILEKIKEKDEEQYNALLNATQKNQN